MGKTIVGSDNVEYELLDLQEFKDRAHQDRLIFDAVNWIYTRPQQSYSFSYGRNRNAADEKPSSTLPDKVYYHPSVLEAISKLAHTDHFKWEFFVGFAPPVAQLTLDDFLAWCEKRYKAKEGKTSYGSIQGLMIREGYSAPNRWRSGFGWREQVLTDASEYTENTKGYSAHNWLMDVFEDALHPRDAKQDVIEDAIRLNEYLHGEGKDFTGTFEEYLATEVSPTVKDYIARYFFKSYGGTSLDDLIDFTGKKTVGYYGPTVQARARKLLYAQDRDVWLQIIKTSDTYSKGKSFQHLQQYLAETHEKMGRGKASKYNVLSPSDLRREYTLLVAEAVLFEGRSYNPNKLHGLATVALQAVPSEHELKKYAREYSEIYLMVRDLLTTRKEQDENAADHITLMQTIGLLLATFYPRAWLRTNPDNGPYILRDMIQEKGLAAIQLLSEIVLEHVGTVPTENEWRKALQDVDFDTPAEFFMVMVCSANALKKNQPKGYSDIVKDARSKFGVR